MSNDIETIDLCCSDSDSDDSSLSPSSDGDSIKQEKDVRKYSNGVGTTVAVSSASAKRGASRSPYVSEKCERRYPRGESYGGRSKSDGLTSGKTQPLLSLNGPPRGQRRRTQRRMLTVDFDGASSDDGDDSSDLDHDDDSDSALLHQNHQISRRMGPSAVRRGGNLEMTPNDLDDPSVKRPPVVTQGSWSEMGETTCGTASASCAGSPCSSIELPRYGGCKRTASTRRRRNSSPSVVLLLSSDNEEEEEEEATTTDRRHTSDETASTSSVPLPPKVPPSRGISDGNSDDLDLVSPVFRPQFASSSAASTLDVPCSPCNPDRGSDELDLVSPGFRPQLTSGSGASNPLDVTPPRAPYEVNFENDSDDSCLISPMFQSKLTFSSGASDSNVTSPKARSQLHLENEDSEDSDLASPVFQPQINAIRTPIKRSPLSWGHSISMDLQSPFFQPELTAAVSASGGSRSSAVSVRRRVPVPPLCPALLNELGGRLYPDLRHTFIRYLTSHARTVRQASYQRASFDAAVRAATALALRRDPIRSAESMRRLRGVGGDLASVLKEAAAAKGGGRDISYVPARGRFSAVAPAALVAMVEFERDNPEQPLCSMEELVQRINAFIDIKAGVMLNQEISYYLNKDTMDPGWSQVKKLCASNVNACIVPLLKERRKKYMCDSGIVYELLDEGRILAKRLWDALQNGTSTTYMGPLRQLAAESVDQDYGNVTMSMDFREGGGGSKSLHKMCDILDEHGVPYVVRELKISDYVFFVGDKLAPILIERKSADDVANSLADGRWERQQRSMRKAQYVLGGGAARRCQICYLIEGDPSRRVVHGGNVGRVSWNQSLEDVENAIEALPKLGFSVMRTKSVMGSMTTLARIARDVSWKADNGSIDATCGYKEFLDRVKRLDNKEGDPPSAQEHQYPAPPVVDASILRHHSATSKVLRAPLDASINGLQYHMDEGVNEKEKELKKLSVSRLKQMCKDRDEKQSGTKADLISRLLKERKPEILISRSRQGKYVPKIPSCNAALMVALFLNHRAGTEGLSKESLMLLAEETGISKESMDAKNGRYDGWAGMKDLTTGDPALVCISKGRKYALTTQPTGTAGWDVSRALHIVAHRESICRCGKQLLS